MNSVNTTEQRFKDMINETFFANYRKQFLHDLNNLCYHSQIENIFTLPQVHPDAKVEMRWSAIRNPLTSYDHEKRGLKTIYHPYLPAVVIKLDSSSLMYKISEVTHGELLIGVDSSCIEIHIYREDMPKSIMAVKPHQILKAIDALMG